MKSLRVFLLLSAFFCFVETGLAQNSRVGKDQCASDKWYKFVSLTFEIDFPCKPERIEQLKSNSTLVFSGWTATTNYGLIIQPIARELLIKGSDNVLDLAVATQLGDSETTKRINSKTVRVNGQLARELTFEKAGNVIVGRLLIHRDSLFILSVNEAKQRDSTSIERGAVRFFNSLTLK